MIGPSLSVTLCSVYPGCVCHLGAGDGGLDPRGLLAPLLHRDRLHLQLRLHGRLRPAAGAGLQLGRGVRQPGQRGAHSDAADRDLLRGGRVGAVCGPHTC